MTHSRRRIHELLDGSGLSPRRDLGQNFVADPNTVRRIAALAGVGPGDRVVEIGAGLGSLSLALAETGADVLAIEVDRGLAELLRAVVGGSDADARIEVVEADATALDWHRLLAPHRGWTLVANLPYNVATPLVCDLLDDVHEIDSMLVMVQREVAERLVAGPGSKDYGLPSVVANLYAEARLAFRVPPQVFVPPPNVESAVVRLERTAEPSPLLDRAVELAGQAFNQRRKMLRSSLRGRLDDAVAVLEAAGLDPTSRAEDVAASGYLALAEEVGP